MAPHLEEGDWRPIAELASKELDPQKLMILIGKLCCALEGEPREKPRRNEPQGLFSAIRRTHDYPKG
jgi:hypothetical protein